MAKFTSSIDLDLTYHGHDLRGPAGTVFRLPDSLKSAFQADYGTRISINWTAPDQITALEEGGGDHPDLATHNTLGLATQAELDAHEISSDPHTAYALDSDLSGHVAAADPHTAYQRESEKGVANGYASLDAGGVVPDAQLPSGLARDSEVTTAVSNHEAASDPHTGYVREADANWIDLTDSGQTSLHSHVGGGGEAFPVGSIFIAAVSTNPGTLLGYGTWAAFAAGRVLVGLDAGDADFDTVEETGGAKTKAISAHSGAAVGTSGAGSSHVHTGPSHTHTYTQVVNHTHPENRNSATTGGLDGWAAGDTSTSTPLQTGYSTSNPAGGVATGTTAADGTGNTGAEASHTHAAGTVTQPSAHSDLNVVQPYIAVFMWKRTA